MFPSLFMLPYHMAKFLVQKLTPVTPVTPKRTCSEQLAGPTPKRQKVVSCLKDVTSTPLPPLLTPQRIPHVTPARVQVHTSTRTDCTPYSGASATPARLKVMASWSGRPFPSTPQPPQPPLPPQPMPPETPIKKLTVDFLRAFLKGKGVSGISRWKKEELLKCYHTFI